MGAAAAPLMIVGGTALSAMGHFRGGIQEERAKRLEAAGYERAAGESLAVSQRGAAEIGRQGRLLESQALALAAASGGASDPSVIRALANLAGESTYRKMTALYEGESQAQQNRLAAKLTRRAGREAARAGRLQVLGTVLSGGATLYGKYGQTPPTLPASSGVTSFLGDTGSSTFQWPKSYQQSYVFKP
jgi:hypothetical protein